MSKENEFTILIADDHSVVRQGVAMILKDNFKFAKIFQAGTFRDTLNVLKENPVRLLILDINFPDGNSLSILEDARELRPDIKILIFSAFDEDVYALRYLNAGANGYLNKLSSEEEIIYAIQTIINSGKYITAKVQDKILESYISGKPLNPIDSLSNREIEIARLMIKGYGNLEISNLLHIQRTTVSTYKTRIFEKLQVDSVPALIEVFKLYFEG